MSTGTDAPKEERVYGGLTATERRERRRKQLIDAGIELFGTRGFQGTSIRAVVRESGLIERYFYESFASLDELFVAVFEQLRVQIFTAMLEAVAAAGPDEHEQIRAGLRAFMLAVTEDPRVARIKLLDEAGMSYRMEERRRGSLEGMVEFIVANAPKSRRYDIRVLAIGVVGAVEEIIMRWHYGELELTLDELVEHCAAVFFGLEWVLKQPAAKLR